MTPITQISRAIPSVHTNVSSPPRIEDAYCSNNGIEAILQLGSGRQVLDVQGPLRSPIVPFRSVDTRLELHVLVDIIRLRDFLPVLSNLVASSVFLAPLPIGRECGLVNVRRYIAPDSWVNVFEPCPALCSANTYDIRQMFILIIE